MSGPFYLWSSTSNLFTTAGVPINAAYWNLSSITGGSYPIFLDSETASSLGASTTTPVVWNIYLMDSDFLGTVQSAQLVATTPAEVNPFGVNGNLAAVSLFSNSRTGAVLFFSPSATTSGDYQLDFVPFSQTFSASSYAVSTNTLGTPTVIGQNILNPVSWNFVTNATSSVNATEMVTLVGVKDPGNGSETDYYVEGVTTAGVANGFVQATTPLPSSSWATVSYSSVNSTFYFDYATTNGPSGFTFYNESFNPTTNAQGSAASYLIVNNFTSIIDEASFVQPDSSHITFVSGFVGAQQVIEEFLGVGAQTAITTLSLASATAEHWRTAQVYDSATHAYDETALVYSDSGHVHLDLFNQSGQQIGSDLITSLTSFDQVQALGTRVEIDYNANNGSGGQTINSVIYDTTSSALTVTLVGGTGEYAGTPFDDTFTWGTGVYTIDGGSGVDTFSATNFSLSQVTLTVDATSEIIVTHGSSSDSDTLRRFSNIALSNASVGISGSALTVSNGTVDLDGAAASILGSGNTIQFLGSGSTATVTGNNNSVYASGTIVSFTIGDSGNTVFGAGDAILDADGAPINVTGNNSTIYTNGSLVGINANSSGDVVSGNGNAIFVANGDTIGVTGLYSSIYASGLAVYLNAGSSGDVVLGNGDAIIANGTSAGVTGNNSTIYASGQAVYLNAGSSGNVVLGSGDAIIVANGDVVGVTGNNSTIYANNSVVFVNANSSGDVIVGNGDTDVVAAGDTIGVTGANATVSAGGATIFVNDSSTGTLIKGGSNLIEVGANVTLTSTGNGDTMNVLATGAALTITGSGDHFQYGAGFGAQSITGFNPAASSGDVISLASSEFASITALISGATMAGGNTLIHGTNGDTLTLIGVNSSSLVAADFSLHS